MAVNTLTIARKIEAAGVETRSAVLTWMVGALAAVMLATLWQVLALRGEITALSASVARIEARAP